MATRADSVRARRQYPGTRTVQHVALLVPDLHDRHVLAGDLLVLLGDLCLERRHRLPAGEWGR